MERKPNWSTSEIEILRRVFADTRTKDIEALLPGRTKHSIDVKAFKLKLKKNDLYLEENNLGLTEWTDEMLIYLKENHNIQTNQALAKKLGVGLTVLRNKASELGLKRIEMEYWTDEQKQFLLDHFKTVGDVEMAEYFEKHWPKNKPWRKEHIRKKRAYLKLHRSAEEVALIRTKNSSEGGNQYTITRNSSSIHMHPTWVAQMLVGRNQTLKQEIVKDPALIEAGRQLIKLKRVIKSKTSKN